MEHLNGVNGVITTVTGALILVGLVVGWIKKGRPAWREFRADFRAGRDTLVGRPPITDSITGAELAPALPGMGQRLDRVETALASIADQDKRISDLEVTVAGNVRDIQRLQEQALERVMTRAESTAAYGAIEAAINAEPPPPIPPTDA